MSKETTATVEKTKRAYVKRNKKEVSTQGIASTKHPEKTASAKLKEKNLMRKDSNKPAKVILRRVLTNIPKEVYIILDKIKDEQGRSMSNLAGRVLTDFAYTYKKK